MSDKPGSQPPSGERIEQLQRRRTRLAFSQGAFFLLWQTTFFSMHTSTPARMADHVKTGAYVLWVVVLLAFIATGGGLSQSREVRAILNDENTRENRRRAIELGFWAAMAAAIGSYVVAQFDTVTPLEVIHAVLTLGVATALFNFALLERRAERDA